MATENPHNPIEGLPASGRVQANINLLSSPSISKSEAMEILTSPAAMAHMFRTRLSNIFPEGSILKECRPQLLKDRQHSRQVVSYRLTFSNPLLRRTKPMNLVAKRFIDRTKGSHEYSNMRMLWEEGFDDKSDLRIPRPFSFLEDLGLLIQERAHGTLLSKKLNYRRPVDSGVLKAAARWSLKLHSLDVNQEEIRPHPNDETLIKACVYRAGGREPNLLTRLEKLGSLVKMKLSSFKEVRFTLIHGDFQGDNIFVDKDKVTVIDLGRFCKSDPARDLGSMIAQARTTVILQSPTFTPGSTGLKAFWEEYLTAVPVAEVESLSERACTYAAEKYLENIDYICSFSMENGRNVVHSLLDDAERLARASRLEETF